MLIQSTMLHQWQPTTVDAIIAARGTTAVTVVLRKWERDLAIATPVGRKVTGPESVQTSRLMRKIQSRKLSLITRMIAMKVPGKHLAEWLSDSWEMGDLMAD